MPRPGPLPPSLPAEGFSVGDAHAAGVGRARLRASDLVAPFHGVRTAEDPSSVASRARAFATRMSPSQYFSHTTAAVLLRLRMPEGFRERVLHVTSIRPQRATRAAGVIGHESAPAATVQVGGMRVLNPIDVWCQLSATLSLDDLVVMGDGLVRRNRPLASMEELQLAVDRYTGRGARRLRKAMKLVRSKSDSARETMLRLIVVRAGFPEPEVNGVILNRFGAKIAHGDLVFRKYRTILEYDGGHHREDEEQFTIDIERLDELMEEGWRVIRVNKSLMARRQTLLGKIATALTQGGWRAN